MPYICFMENKKQIGGKRRGAGRKPVLSKKKQFSFYIEGAQVVKFGNEEKFKKIVTDFIYGYGIEKDYSNPVSELQNLPNYSVHDIKQPLATFSTQSTYTETKSTITGLPPKLSDFDGFMEELNSATTLSEVKGIMLRVKSGIMFPRQKLELEAFANEISADMFDD